MRLSEAILLGDSLKSSTNRQWLSEDGSCGCAFGGAMLAVGITGLQYNSELASTNYGISSIAELYCIKSIWPWLTQEYLSNITGMYTLVRMGNMTIYQLADEVRKWEDDLGVYDVSPGQEDQHASATVGQASTPVLEESLLPQT